jgi:hypothetical protein
MPVWIQNRIYHMTGASNLAYVQRHGLLSTSRLLNLAGIDGNERYDLERRQRLGAQKRPAKRVVGRGWLPHLKALERCLASGLMPEDWHAELNRRVFFWPDTRWLKRQVLAADRDVLATDPQRSCTR